MAIFFLTTSIDSPRGPIGYPIEIPGVDTFEQLFEALAADGCILGSKLVLGPRDASGRRTIASREPRLLTLAGIREVGPYDFDK